MLDDGADQGVLDPIEVSGIARAAIQCLPGRTDVAVGQGDSGRREVAAAPPPPADEPFFLYFNHSNVHFPTLPREEYIDSSNGGAVADCIQMLDGDFEVLLDKLDELGITDNTIVVFAADNGRFVAGRRRSTARRATRFRPPRATPLTPSTESTLPRSPPRRLPL